MINLHTHTVRCGHASGTDRAYIEAAIGAGCREFGFADHSPIDFREMFAGNPKLDADAVFAYVADLRALRKEYEKDITIHIGYETEFYTDIFSENLRIFREAGVEYLIQGQHFTTKADGSILPAAFPTDSPEALRNYLNLLLGGARSGAFTYLAHPDLINFTGADAVYLEEMERFLQEVKSIGACLEFNRLGYFEHRNYPDDRFWRLVAAYQIPTVIGLDAHQPEVFGDQETLVRIYEYLDKLGIRVQEPVLCRL